MKERFASYEEVTDFKLLQRLPVIISINGRSFSKITSLLDKPFCSSFADAMKHTVSTLVQEIEGVVFAYSFSDQIILVCRNDQSHETKAWYSNRIQNIVSVASSLATLSFVNYANSIDLDLMSGSVFLTKVYTVPSISEAANLLVFKQEEAMHEALYFSLYYEFIKKHSKDHFEYILDDLEDDEKVKMLYDRFGIDFYNYSNLFRLGFACYRVPKVINDTVKNKWFLDENIVNFRNDYQFVTNILKNGADIIRADNI